MLIPGEIIGDAMTAISGVSGFISLAQAQVGSLNRNSKGGDVFALAFIHRSFESSQKNTEGVDVAGVMSQPLPE